MRRRGSGETVPWSTTVGRSDSSARGNLIELSIFQVMYLLSLFSRFKSIFTFHSHSIHPTSNTIHSPTTLLGVPLHITQSPYLLHQAPLHPTYSHPSIQLADHHQSYALLYRRQCHSSSLRSFNHSVRNEFIKPYKRQAVSSTNSGLFVSHLLHGTLSGCPIN